MIFHSFGSQCFGALLASSLRHGVASTASFDLYDVRLFLGPYIWNSDHRRQFCVYEHPDARRRVAMTLCLTTNRKIHDTISPQRRSHSNGDVHQDQDSFRRAITLRPIGTHHNSSRGLVTVGRPIPLVPQDRTKGDLWTIEELDALWSERYCTF